MLDLLQPPLPLFDQQETVEASAQPSKRQSRTSPRPDIGSSSTGATPSPCEAAQRRALRLAFQGLAARWALTGSDVLTLLGELLASETERYERMGNLVGLNRSLLLLLPEPNQTSGYLRRPCPAFDDASPLQLMLAGGLPAIARVRAHLAAAASP